MKKIREIRESVSKSTFKDASKDSFYSKIPMSILLRRQSIRSFPNDQFVALYYSPLLDYYVTIPFGQDKVGQAMVGPIKEELLDEVSQALQLRAYIKSKQKENDIEKSDLSPIDKAQAKAKHEKRSDLLAKHAKTSVIDPKTGSNVRSWAGKAAKDLAKEAGRQQISSDNKGKSETPAQKFASGLSSSDFGHNVGYTAGVAAGHAAKLIGKGIAALGRGAAQKAGEVAKSYSSDAQATKNVARDEFKARRNKEVFKGLKDVAIQRRSNRTAAQVAEDSRTIFKDKLNKRRLEEEGIMDTIRSKVQNFKANTRIGQALSSVDNIGGAFKPSEGDWAKAGVATAGLGVAGAAVKAAAPALARVATKVGTSPVAQAAVGTAASNALTGDNSSSAPSPDLSRNFAKPKSYQFTQDYSKNVSNPKRVTQGGSARAASRVSMGLSQGVSDSRQRMQEDVLKQLRKNTSILINEESVSINKNTADKVLFVYKSLNVTNRKRFKDMLNEDANSFRKAVNFALRYT